MLSVGGQQKGLPREKRKKHPRNVLGGSVYVFHTVMGTNVNVFSKNDSIIKYSFGRNKSRFQPKLKNSFVRFELLLGERFSTLNIEITIGTHQVGSIPFTRRLWVQSKTPVWILRLFSILSSEPCGRLKQEHVWYLLI